MEEKLFAGAFELFMQYGVKSVTMDDIASHLGISKKTIYQVVDNKKVLVYTVIEKFIAKDEEDIYAIIQTSENAISEMQNIGEHIYQLLRRMKPSLMFDLQKYHRDAWELIRKKHYSFIQKLIKNNIDRGITEGFYREDIDSRIIAKFYTQSAHVAIDDHIFPNREFPKPALFLEHLKYHMNGVLKEEARKKFNEKYITH